MKGNYLIQGYTEMTYKGEIKDIAVIRVVASNEAEAIEKAKKLVTKKAYRVGEVSEARESIREVIKNG